MSYCLCDGAALLSPLVQTDRSFEGFFPHKSDVRQSRAVFCVLIPEGILTLCAALDPLGWFCLGKFSANFQVGDLDGESRASEIRIVF